MSVILTSKRRTRGVRGKNESPVGAETMRGLRFGIRVAGLGVAVGLALQTAQAGERKSAAARHAGSSLRADVPQTLRSGASRLRQDYGAPGFSFFPVGPLKSEVRDLRSEVGDARREPTPPHERKNITLFRLDPKFGDISVQPVVGGAKGAQISVGF